MVFNFTNYSCKSKLLASTIKIDDRTRYFNNLADKRQADKRRSENFSPTNFKFHAQHKKRSGQDSSPRLWGTEQPRYL